MNIAHEIREYIDPDSGRRLVSVSFGESGEVHIPFDILADDLLEFLADSTRFYGAEAHQTDGFRYLEKMILDHHKVAPN